MNMDIDTVQLANGAGVGFGEIISFNKLLTEFFQRELHDAGQDNKIDHQRTEDNKNKRGYK